MWLAIKSRRIELWSVAVVHLDVGAEKAENSERSLWVSERLIMGTGH